MEVVRALNPDVVATLAATAAGYGVYLIYTSVALRWDGRGPRHARDAGGPAERSFSRLVSKADERDAKQLLALTLVACGAGLVLGFLLFGATLGSVSVAAVAAGLPTTAARSRRRQRREAALNAWPGMLEEMRMLTGSLGRSVPQALFEMSRHAPGELKASFAEAEREWVVSTDFGRTVSTLKRSLADPTADVVLETLLVAHELGGTNLALRLARLSEDRKRDLEARKTALARQAGVRFARRFVLVVPLGMAVAGLSIGTGRAAYGTGAGQAAVAAGVGTTAVCWWWAGRMLRLPLPGRVFADPDSAGPASRSASRDGSR